MVDRTPLRVNLELYQEDDGWLYADLSEKPKGKRRVGRLRTLALLGLMAERVGLTPLPDAAAMPRVEPPAGKAQSGVDDIGRAGSAAVGALFSQFGSGESDDG